MRVRIVSCWGLNHRIPSYLLRLDRVMGVRGISEGVTLVRLDCPWCYTEEGQPVNELIVRESEAELLGVLQQ
jgi:hypothetical protein